MPQARFSIIVRYTGKAQSLAGLLRALCDLDYPSDRFEVIVADSSSGRVNPADLLPDEAAYRMMHLPVGAASRPEALNIAVRESKGEFLAFLDQDCMPAPDWLSRYDQAFDAWLAGVIGGGYLPPRDGDTYQKCAGLVHDSLARSLGSIMGNQLVGKYYPRSSNMAARRESVLLAGGFDEQAAECPEIRMTSRMHRIGYRVFYCPSAVVHRYHDTGFFQFLSGDFRTAAERARFCRQPIINILSLGTVALFFLMLGLALGADSLVGHAVKVAAGGYALTLAVSSLHAAVSVGSLAVAVFLPMFLAMHHLVYAIGLAYGRFTRV